MAEGLRNTPPYMVALAGWPEPVFVAGPSMNSRSNTPGPGSNEVRDGIDPSLIPSSSQGSISPGSGLRAESSRKASITKPPEESIFSRTCMYNADPTKPCPIPDHPNHVAKYAVFPYSLSSQPIKAVDHLSNQLSNSRAASPSAFPTSSERNTPHHSPTPSRSGSPKPFPTLQLEHSHDPHTVGGKTFRPGEFHDPRFAPHAAVDPNRPLPIAPNWISSSGSSSEYAASHLRRQSKSGTSTPNMRGLPPHTGLGMKVSAGQRGTGILVMRAVPDVYPPPAPTPGMAGMMSAMTRTGSSGVSRRSSRVNIGASASNDEQQMPGGQMATEVYPRDPDSAFLWGSGVPSRSNSVSLSQDHSIRQQSSEMDVDKT